MDRGQTLRGCPSCGVHFREEDKEERTGKRSSGTKIGVKQEKEPAREATRKKKGKGGGKKNKSLGETISALSEN